MHPIAGQGLNAGLRDVGALGRGADAKPSRRGEDIGNGSTGSGTLSEWRRFDTAALGHGDGRVQQAVFQRQPASAARCAIMGMGHRESDAGAAPQLHVREAAGLTGDLPKRLMRRSKTPPGPERSARFIHQHDRNAVADRKGEVRGLGYQFLTFGIIGQNGVCHRADQCLKHTAVGFRVVGSLQAILVRLSPPPDRANCISVVKRLTPGQTGAAFQAAPAFPRAPAEQSIDRELISNSSSAFFKLSQSVDSPISLKERPKRSQKPVAIEIRGPVLGFAQIATQILSI